MPLALQTAIVSFAAAGDRHRGVQVDLVGAIHIADKAYYDELNRRFRGYDAVLYELVAREEANVPQPGQSPGTVVGGMQVGMKSLLGLEYQLDGIDYARKNLVHADMSPEEFAATMKSRKESFAGMFFRMLGRAMAEQAKDPFGTGDFQIAGRDVRPRSRPAPEAGHGQAVREHGRGNRHVRRAGGVDDHHRTQQEGV